MSLHELNVDATDIPIPDPHGEVMDLVDQRIDAYLSRDIKERAPRYVPSNAEDAYRALVWIRQNNLAEGNRFCEWGSGFGMITLLAALAGFDATGVEIVESLYEEAVQLADDLNIPARFLNDDSVPEGFEYASDGTGEAGALTSSFLLPSQEGERESFFEPVIPMEELDVIYCYPWPGEAGMIEDLFDATAAEGTLLVTYCETDRIRIREKA